YSLFDGGTRVIFIARWTGTIKPGTSDAPFSQIDLLASFAALTGQKLEENDAPDSFNMLNTLLGKDKKGREWLVEHSGRLTIIRGDWKYIEPGPGAKITANTNTETGNDPMPQLYNLKNDIGEKNNLAKQHPDIVNELKELLDKIKAAGRTRN
ncbi:MAG: arylsulfatase, partial [Bacteroidales bacterium]